MIQDSPVTTAEPQLGQAERPKQPRAGLWELLAVGGSGLQRLLLSAVCIQHQKPQSQQLS